MGRIVVMLSMSLDGYIGGPQGEIDWHLVDGEVHRYYNDVLRPMSAFLAGRVNHEMMAEFWPTADKDPDSPPEMVEFAEIWRSKPKYMYSRTTERSDWNTTTVREVVPAEVQALKDASSADLTLGGPDLVESFRKYDLIDEYHLCVNPILLGRGLPMFRDFAERTPLRLVGTRTFGNGVVLLRHERAR